jgi:hypothetical protein
MRQRCPFAALLFLATAGVLSAAQDPAALSAQKPPEPVFVRLSVYPTASLSRYDYANDIDLYEIRIYAEVRRGSQEGAAIADAVITSLSEKLEYLEDHYEKRIPLDKDRLPPEFDVEIAVKGRPVIRERFPLPAWLVLMEPRPAIVDPGTDLGLRWRFSRFPAPVDVRAYDFRTGKEFFRRDHVEGTSAVIGAADLPASTIIRIYAIQSWLSKRFLSGDDYARGSEINVIPWSQVFIRTK